MSAAVSAIVPAAGLGTRLADGGTEGSVPPKAYRRLAGRTLLQRSVDVLGDLVDSIVVAVPADLVDQTRLDAVAADVTVIAGGDTRQQSVSRALRHVDSSVTAVLVHDAARALVPAAVVRRVLAAVQAGAPCVVPVVTVADSLREVDSDGRTRPVDRSRVRLVQTPQGFAAEALRRAHAAATSDLATDDASLVEALGVDVTVVEGDPLAFKITRPVDLVLAEALLAAQR